MNDFGFLLVVAAFYIRGSLGQGDLTGVIRSTFDRYFEPRGVLQVCPDRNTRDSSSYQCVGLNSNYMVNPMTLEGDGNYYGSMCNVGYKATSNDCSSVSNTVSYHHHMTIVSYRFLYHHRIISLPLYVVEVVVDRFDEG